MLMLAALVPAMYNGAAGGHDSPEPAADAAAADIGGGNRVAVDMQPYRGRSRQAPSARR
jgi:hypothetical protein